MTILPFRQRKVTKTPETRRPVIGITSYGRDEKRRFRLSVDYVDAVRAAGGIPIILPSEEPAIRETFDLLDGLILSGGGDIEPERYQGMAHPRVYNVDSRRDDFEFELCSLALESACPMLCICRGAQLLNVFMGGSLHPHLPDVVGDKIAHQVEINIDLEETSHSFHPVIVDPLSKLAKTLGLASLALPADSQSVATGSESMSSTTGSPHHLQLDAGASRVSLPLEIASWHHQGVRELGQGLCASAWAADGTIEAFELAQDGVAFVQAVQWHPEITAARDALQQRLFESLVAASLS